MLSKTSIRKQKAELYFMAYSKYKGSRVSFCRFFSIFLLLIYCVYLVKKKLHIICCKDRLTCDVRCLSSSCLDVVGYCIRHLLHSNCFVIGCFFIKNMNRSIHIEIFKIPLKLSVLQKIILPELNESIFNSRKLLNYG